MRTYIRHERQVGGPHRLKVYRPWFIDPYPWVQGSKPEKMVMAELARRGIFFLHTPQTNNLGGAVDPSWEADIMVPQYRIWIEVQGSYFHSLEGQIEKDSYRYAAIKQAGWRPYFWWEFDILNRLQELVDDVPEFYIVKPLQQEKARQRYGATRGLPFNEDGGKGIDHLKGLRTRNAMRRQPTQMIYRHRFNYQRREK